MVETTEPRVGAGTRVRSVARGITVLALVLAVADVARWGNRWYVSTMLADAPDRALELLAAAHGALVTALVWLLVAAVAAAVGWRLRVVATR